MAGFFGMFDATKPGPGVSKNEPKKKRFFLFWELYFRKFFKLVLAGLLYTAVSLPVITCGLAQAGLTFVTRNYSREKHVFLPSDFFDTIKKNWKQALLSGIIELVVGALLGFGIFYGWSWLNSGDSINIMALLHLGVSFFLFVVFLYARYYVYMQIITFKFSLNQVWKNSVLFAFAGFKENFIISLSLVAIYALMIGVLAINFWLMLGPVVILYVLFFPAFRSFLIHFTIFPVVKRLIIDPYYKEHPDEDLDKRHDLNLDAEKAEVSKTDETNAEAIFTDVGKQKIVADDSIPRQYSQEELRKGRRVQRTSKVDSDDDGTI